MAAIFSTLALMVSAMILPSQANPMAYLNASIDRPMSSAAQCTPYLIPLNITSLNIIVNLTHFTNDLDLAKAVSDITGKNSQANFHPVGGIENVTAVYTISGTFCSPKTPAGNGREKTVLLATHGGGYDGQYWDSAYKPHKYSFVVNMVKDGFSVFYYDRLGLGNSQIISGYVSQIPIHTEIAASLSKLLRQGQYTGTVGAAKSIVLVGHSLGSYVSNDVLKGYPTLADAAVLTGSAYATALSDQGTFIAALGLRISAQHDPTRYAALDTGYFGFVDLAAHITTFFKAPAYELEAALYAHSIAAPIAIAEFLSAGPVNSSIAPTYTGPVLVTTGEFDFGLCDGDCYPTYAAQKLETIFPASKYIDAFIHPGAAHGVNFAKNATGFYERITAFLGRAGF